MKIKTNLPHEINGGYTLALFGKPRIKMQKAAGHLIYVDCHIITAVKKEHGFMFIRTYEMPKLSKSTLQSMLGYARKLAQSHITQKKWCLKKTTRFGKVEFIRNKVFSGFYFEIET